MERSDDKRKKLLYILDYLLENTDENHAVKNADIIEHLSKAHNIPVERKTIYTDIKLLQEYGEQVGIEIEYDPVEKGYKVIRRQFDLDEIQLIIEALYNSKFASKNKIKKLLKKLKRLISVHDWALLALPPTYSELQNTNDSAYYSLDKIRDAIKRDKKISFRYFNYDSKKEKVYEDKIYVVSPYLLRIHCDRYLLLAAEDNPRWLPLWDFEVNRMDSITTLDKKRTGKELVQDEKRFIRLRFAEGYIQTVLDTFGKDNISLVPDGDNFFTASLTVDIESDFYDWILRQGDTIQVIGPPEEVKSIAQALEREKKIIERALRLYQ